MPKLESWLMDNKIRAPARARNSVSSSGNCLGDPVPLELHRQQLEQLSSLGEKTSQRYGKGVNDEQILSNDSYTDVFEHGLS